MTGVIAPPTRERWSPALTGLLAQTCDTGDANGTLTPTTQDALGFWVPIITPISVSQIWVSISSAGIGLTAGQNLLSLNDVNGNLLSLSADQSATWLGQGTFNTPLPGGPFVLPTPGCWVQLVAGGTTVPTFRGGAGSIAANVGPGLTLPGTNLVAALRAQRVALGAISLGSFNPNTSNTPRNMVLIGLS